MTEKDVDVARALKKVGINADFSRCVDTNDSLVIVAGRDTGRIIGKGGKNMKEIEGLLGKSVDVIEEGDEKSMIEKLLRVPVVGLNKVYGEREKYKVRVEKRFRTRVRKPYTVAEKVIGKKISVVFE